MTSVWIFLLVITLIVGIVMVLVLTSQAGQSTRHSIARWLTRDTDNRQPRDTGAESAEFELEADEEDESLAELKRLQSLIENRKRIAWDTDISYHLWDFYKSHFRAGDDQSELIPVPEGKWYRVKILQSACEDGVNRCEFELKDSRYLFTDDEERQGWRDKTKQFSLCLYDHEDRCLIEVPMRMRLDKLGRTYSISSGGPTAFLPGDWIKDFIYVKLKHQSLLNQEIRRQKHEERLHEIEEMKDRFGISD